MQIPQFDFVLTPRRGRRGRSRLNAASGVGQYGTILRCRKRTCEVERSLRCRKPMPGSSRREPAALSGRLVLWGYLGNSLGSQGRLGIGLGPLEVLRVSKETFVAAKTVRTCATPYPFWSKVDMRSLWGHCNWGVTLQHAVRNRIG